MENATTRTWQYDRLRQDWPRTLEALQCTFLTGSGWYVTTITGQNDAGYLLACLGKYEAKACGMLQHKGVERAHCDMAAAGEVMYKWQQRPRWNNAVHAICACILGLPIERPQKITQHVSRRLVSQQNKPLDIPVKGPYA